MNQQEIAEEVRDKTPGLIASIFTSRVVGGLFAVAFGSWSLVLLSLKNDWMEGQRLILEKVTANEVALAEVKARINEHGIFAATEGTRISVTQQNVLRWIEKHDALHEHESGK